MVGGIGVGVVRIPAEGETEVPLVVEGNSLAAKDACSLEEIDRDGIAQLGIELMVGESDTLVCPFVNLGNRRVRVFHEGIFELVGSGMVHRALLWVVAHKEIIGMQDATRTEVGTDEMNLMIVVGRSRWQGVADCQGVVCLVGMGKLGDSEQCHTYQESLDNRVNRVM